MKNLIILRGASGSGKNEIAELFHRPCIFSADDYYRVTGDEFSIESMKKAHKWCIEQALNAMKSSVITVVIANTNASQYEFQVYEEIGKEFGYRVHVLIVENRHGSKSIHNVPKHTLENQAKNILQSIKLI